MKAPKFPSPLCLERVINELFCCWRTFDPGRRELRFFTPPGFSSKWQKIFFSQGRKKIIPESVLKKSLASICIVLWSSIFSIFKGCFVVGKELEASFLDVTSPRVFFQRACCSPPKKFDKKSDVRLTRALTLFFPPLR